MRTIKINYIPYKKDKKGLTVKNYAFSKINQGLEILENITLLEMKTIMFLTSFQKLPTSSNKTKLRRIDTQDQIIKCINTNRKSFGDTIKSLEKKNYLIITDDEYILNVDQIEKDIQNVWENKVSSILKDDTKYELTERELKHFKSLEKLIAVGAADEDDLKEYEELKALLQGCDDKEDDLEANEQETITNTTKEIKAEKQPKIETTTIEVEKTQKEAVLDVEKEFKHKDTSSIIQPVKQPEIFPKHEQTEEEMVQEYLNRLIKPTRVQILTIQKFINNYFTTKDPKNLIDLEYQMRLYEKAQNDQDSHKAYDDRRSDWEDDISNYDEDGNLNLMDGGINL